jgi:hypothetical protein
MSNIKCPSCGTQFALNDALTDELTQMVEIEKAKIEAEKKQLRGEMEKYLKNKDEDYNNKIKLKEEEFKNKVGDFDKQKIAIEQNAKLKANEEFTVIIKSLEEERNEKVKQVQDFQKKELDLMREKSELEQKQKNIEVEIEKRLITKTKEVEQDISKREQELFDIKMKEKETQMDSLKKTIEELKRKSEQGSMQIQGEALELMLEELLKESFPYDNITEVGKGVEGADCIQTVTTKTGQQCGAIIYESKNAKHWKNEWVEKLKTDKRNKNADVAILVTQVFPKNMIRFGEVDGVWVCSFAEVIALANVIRNGIIQINEVQKTQENKGDKMQMLYSYLTGNEFRGQVEGIVEGFVSMRNSITKERITMEKIWKEREKQIEKVLISTSGLFGSVKGIAGSSIEDIPLLDGEY